MEKLSGDVVSGPETFAGQCACGAVQFQLTAPLGTISHCHCRSCRLSRGVAFVTWTSVPPTRFAYLRGKSEVFWRRSSPGVRWGSCRACASPMFYIADHPGHPDEPTVGHVYVSLGSLTSAIQDRPVAHVSWEERVGWIEGADTLPKFRGKTEEPTA